MLTDVAIKRMGSVDKRREVPDGKVSGLYLVVQPSGLKSWAVRYRVAGAPKKLTLGSYPAIDLAEARRKALEALGQVAGGNDPAGEKTAARTAAKAEHVDQVERVVNSFVERYAKRETRDWRETQRLLNREIVGPWKGRRLHEIGKADVYALLDKAVDRDAPITARNAFAAFRKMCNWAVSRGIIEKNPCDGVAAPSPPRPRDRVLDDDELRLAWRAFERLGFPFGDVGKILILTGARRDEVAGMRWSEVDLGAKVWTLPKERTKNGREHVIPLSDAAMRIIEGLPRIEGKTGLVFTTTGGRTPVSGFSRAKAAIDAAILEAMKEEAEARGDDPADVEPPEHWQFHDLRRSMATNLQKLGVRLEVTEAVLGHISGSRSGIVGVYQRHTWAQEKRAALDAWGRRLEAIVAPSNVVALRSASAQ
jgi:integrase